MDLYRISKLRLNPLTCNQECHKPCIQALHKYPNQAVISFEERSFVLELSQRNHWYIQILGEKTTTTIFEKFTSRHGELHSEPWQEEQSPGGTLVLFVASISVVVESVTLVVV